MPASKQGSSPSEAESLVWITPGIGPAWTPRSAFQTFHTFRVHLRARFSPGYGASLETESYVIAVVGTEGPRLQALGERNRHLVKSCEAALAAPQDRLVEPADVPEIRMVAAADHRLIGWKRLAKYS